MSAWTEQEIGMRETHQIEIDFDVYKAIELARQSFADTQNNVLRRLFGIDSSQPVAKKIATAQTTFDEIQPQGRSWSGKNVLLPHGTRLRMDYNGISYLGEILDGKWVVDGQTFSSPSAAANGVAITKDGTTTQLNGWVYWEVRLPQSTKWTQLKSMRRR